MLKKTKAATVGVLLLCCWNIPSVSADTGDGARHYYWTDEGYGHDWADEDNWVFWNGEEYAINDYPDDADDIADIGTGYEVITGDQYDGVSVCAELILASDSLEPEVAGGCAITLGSLGPVARECNTLLEAQVQKAKYRDEVYRLGFHPVPPLYDVEGAQEAIKVVDAIEWAIKKIDAR